MQTLILFQMILRNMCVVSRSSVAIAMLMLVILIFSKGSFAAGKIFGGCDSSGECSAHISGIAEHGGLCDSSALSVFWTRGRDAYLVQCRRNGTMGNNSLWVALLNDAAVSRMDYGRYISKSYLAGAGSATIPDEFGEHPLCGAMSKRELSLSEFIVAEKKPSSEVDGLYCYDLVYVRMENGNIVFLRDGSSYNRSVVSRQSHKLSKEERGYIIRTINIVKKESRAW